MKGLDSFLERDRARRLFDLAPHPRKTILTPQSFARDRKASSRSAFQHRLQRFLELLGFGVDCPYQDACTRNRPRAR